MKSTISYKNCLIRSQSFQLAQSSSWIPRFTLTRPDTDSDWTGIAVHHDRLDKVFCTENEADEFALQDAIKWIDKN